MLLGGALAAGAVPGAHPSLAGIIAAGVLGNVAGSYIAWAVGRYAGLTAVRRWGRRVGIREREIDRATAWFERHGSAAVLVGRLVPWSARSSRFLRGSPPCRLAGSAFTP